MRGARGPTRIGCLGDYLLRELQNPVPVPVSDRRPFAGGFQLLPAIFPYRLQQPVAQTLGNLIHQHQRAIHQRVQHSKALIKGCRSLRQPRPEDCREARGWSITEATAGIYGTAPNLNPTPSNPTLENNGADVTFETDFRSVYAQVIDNWLGASSVQLLNGNFKKAGLSFV